MPRLSAGISGVAGEYFVAAELSRRGLIACLTLKNTRGVDVLVADSEGHSARIQVKTKQDSAKEWVLSKAAEEMADEEFFYVFVNLNGMAEPQYHIVPSTTVEETVKREHADWLSGTKWDGSARRDSSMRTFRDRKSTYKDAWHLLGLTIEPDITLDNDELSPEGGGI